MSGGCGWRRDRVCVLRGSRGRRRNVRVPQRVPTPAGSAGAALWERGRPLRAQFPWVMQEATRCCLHSLVALLALSRSCSGRRPQRCCHAYPTTSSPPSLPPPALPQFRPPPLFRTAAARVRATAGGGGGSGGSALFASASNTTPRPLSMSTSPAIYMMSKCRSSCGRCATCHGLTGAAGTGAPSSTASAAAVQIGRAHV